MTLDLLGRIGQDPRGARAMAMPSCGAMSALRLPLLISRFLPFSVLLGTLIAFAGLNQHSEVIAMKAAGISAHQILAPLIVASLGDRGARLRLQRDRGRQVGARGHRLERQRLSPDPARKRGAQQRLAARSARTCVRARHVGGSGASFHAERLTIYDREGGALRRDDRRRARRSRRAHALAARGRPDLRSAMNLVSRRARK